MNKATIKMCVYKSGTPGFPEIEGEFIRFHGSSVVVRRTKEVSVQDFVTRKISTHTIQATEYWPRAKVVFRETL